MDFVRINQITSGKLLQKSKEEKKKPTICGKRLFAPLLGLFGTQVELCFSFPIEWRRNAYRNPFAQQGGQKRAST